MYILNSSTVRVYEVTTPLTNGYLDECLTLSNIRANNFIFRIHYSNSFAWSASIDNFEVAFDYTPAEAPTPPEPFLELPWDYEAKEKSFEEVVFNPRSWFDHEYPLQNVPCCENKVLKYTGELKDEPYRSHNGYDYGSKNGVFLGTEVLAAASGWATFKPESQSGGAGNVIKIDHGNGYQTWYEHLSPDNLIISSTEGRVYVEKGQKIGEVGMTGNTTGPHIHFSVFKDSNENDSFDDDIPWGAVDPLGWEGNYADPWTLFESNGRNGSQSYNLFIARTPPKQEEIQTTGGQVSIGDILVDIVSDTFNQAMQFIADYGPYESSSDGKIKSVMPSIFLNAFDSLGQKVTEFLQPATILYDYSDADLLNINEDSLKIYWFNEDSGEWEALPSFVDSINKTVSTQTTHFSQFALMGEIKDLTPPVTDVIISGEKGQDNWYRSNVSIELNGYDNEDGVGIQYTLYTFNGSDWFEYKDPILISDEGTYTLTYESYDKAENTEDRKAAVFKIDKTPPELSANVTVEGEPYATNTWTNRDVLITFSCVDGLSGVFWFSDPVLIVSEGENQKVTGECKDNAGNTVEEEVEGINIDKTNPSISIWITPQILWPPNGKLVPVTVDGEIQELNLSSKTFNIIDEYGFEMPQINDFGKAIYLQAQRNDWDFDGREYIINVEAIDLAGNKSSTQTKVVVPHDQGKE
ncbi:MAG: M23 family metallopeptidase [Candidatus Levybacteria bacterium]|nr:M23 family metallopeptidase [Candidatus Levybacteria bacterium]